MAKIIDDDNNLHLDANAEDTGVILARLRRNMDALEKARKTCEKWCRKLADKQMSGCALGCVKAHTIEVLPFQMDYVRSWALLSKYEMDACVFLGKAGNFVGQIFSAMASGDDICICELAGWRELCADIQTTLDSICTEAINAEGLCSGAGK